MKKILLLLLLGNPILDFAQQISYELNNLAQAERNFALRCKDVGLKKSFSEYFDSSVIYFAGGNQVIFHDYISKIPDPNPEVDRGYMIWQPIYADISSSNDFGYTTGPVYLFKSVKDTVPQGFMYYSSVWIKNSGAKWKVVMDLGVVIPGAPREDLLLKTTDLPLKSNSVKVNNSFNGLMEVEKKYCQQLNSLNRSFEISHLSNEVRIHRINQYPSVGINASSEIKEDNHSFSYTFMGGRMASSCDMGFTYGKASIDVKKDGKIINYPCIYYRVWKQENNEWKIVLDVVGLTG